MYDKFIKTLPHIGFTDLNPDTFQELINNIRQEPDLYIQRFYFGQVMNRLFNGHEIIRMFQSNNHTYRIIPVLFKTYGTDWGWFMRLGQAPCYTPRELSVATLSEQQRTDALKILRMVQRMHNELKYQPNYIDVINWFMREFGAPQTPARDVPFAHESIKTLRAITAFSQGQKVPRKMKKHIKKLTQNSR